MLRTYFLRKQFASFARSCRITFLDLKCVFANSIPLRQFICKFALLLANKPHPDNTKSRGGFKRESSAEKSDWWSDLAHFQLSIGATLPFLNAL